MKEVRGVERAGAGEGRRATYKGRGEVRGGRGMEQAGGPTSCVIRDCGMSGGGRNEQASQAMDKPPTHSSLEKPSLAFTVLPRCMQPQYECMTREPGPS